MTFRTFPAVQVHSNSCDNNHQHTSDCYTARAPAHVGLGVCREILFCQVALFLSVPTLFSLA